MQESLNGVTACNLKHVLVSVSAETLTLPVVVNVAPSFRRRTLYRQDLVNWLRLRLLL